jgi:regulator of protease activity HflC (stomatin/prohibitin superfamily)
MRCQPTLNQAPPDNTVAIAGARWVRGTLTLKDVLTRLPTQLNSRIEELLPHSWQPGA